MQKGDKYLSPVINFTDTKANIEAIADPQEGMFAIQSDSPYEMGYYINGGWEWGGGGGGISDGDKGDITVSGSGATWTIDANAVSLSKLATQAANSILAEITGSVDVPTAVTLAANQFLARASAGNIAAKSITDFALTILDDADAATVRATIGAGVGIGTGTAGQVVKWGAAGDTLVDAALIPPASNILTLTNAAASTLGLAITAGKTLTLTATDNFNLTIPETMIASGRNVLDTHTRQIFIDGSADEIQLRIQAHSTQTSTVLTQWESSASVIRAFVAYGTANTQFGLYGPTNTGYIIILSSDTLSQISSASGIPFRFATTNAGMTFQTTNSTFILNATTATNNAIVNAVQFLTTMNSGGAANGFGTNFKFTLTTATAATNQDAAQIAALWTDATNATRKAKLQLSAYDTAQRIGLEILADGVAGITRTIAAVEGVYTTTAINLTLTSVHHWVKVTAACTITLPPCTGLAGREYIITATVDGVIVDGNASELISGETTQTMSAYDTMQIKTDGSNWFVI